MIQRIYKMLTSVVQIIYAKTKKKYLQNQNIQKFENYKENVSKSQVNPYCIKTKAVMTILTIGTRFQILNCVINLKQKGWTLDATEVLSMT